MKNSANRFNLEVCKNQFNHHTYQAKHVETVHLQKQAQQPKSRTNHTIRSLFGCNFLSCDKCCSCPYYFIPELCNYSWECNYCACIIHIKLQNPSTWLNALITYKYRPYRCVTALVPISWTIHNIVKANHQLYTRTLGGKAENSFSTTMARHFTCHTMIINYK